LISLGEAKLLAIHAARADGVPNNYVLDAEVAGQDENSYNFRVFVTNPGPETASNLAGWFTVNLNTAALTDCFDRPVTFPAVRGEQERLRAAHCQP
jgi:hypothetical protein